MFGKFWRFTNSIRTLPAQSSWRNGPRIRTRSSSCCPSPPPTTISMTQCGRNFSAVWRTPPPRRRGGSSSLRALPIRSAGFLSPTRRERRMLWNRSGSGTCLRLASCPLRCSPRTRSCCMSAFGSSGTTPSAAGIRIFRPFGVRRWSFMERPSPGRSWRSC